MTLTGRRPVDVEEEEAPLPFEVQPPAEASDLPESLYIRYLPAIYQHDPFMRRFLLIFESVLAPLEGIVNTLPFYTEPEMAPEAFLPWLAHWVAAALDSDWPARSQRALIAHAVEIYRWRGTKRGLKLHIKAYTGIAPLIQEYEDGFVLGGEARLGWNTTLGKGTRNPLLFTVTAPVSDPQASDPAMLRAIIEEDKPAHAVYRLYVVPAGGR